MTPAAEAAVQVTRLTAQGRAASRDAVVVEEPLEIRLDGEPLSITMRTPGHDAELALGLLWAERVIESLDELRAIDAVAGPPGAGVVDVRLRDAGAARRRVARTFRATASCGVCGLASLEMIGAHGRLSVADDEPRIAPEVLFTLPERMRAAQTVFSTTGGLHAAALFSPAGDLLALREDVGRHNALDKLVGWAVRAEGVDAARAIVLVSGRLSFELVTKALSIGVPIVAAVSAPSSLAVEIGLAHGMTVVGFLRGASANVYSGDERLA